MAKRVQRLGHSGAEAAQFVGYEREITVDVTKESLRVHNNQTPGGIESARADADNIQEAIASTQDGKMTAEQAQQLIDNASAIGDLQQSVKGYIQISVVGNINITPEQAANAVIEIVGTISNYINVIFPDAESVNYIKNSTTGGHSLRCYAQSSTSFIEVKNGEIRGIYYDDSGATFEPKDIVGADASQVYYDNAASSLYSKLGQDAFDELSRGTRQNFSIDVAGGVDVTLTDEEAAYYVIALTGALTANINVIVPDREKPYFITNETTGNFTLRVKTAAGTGELVAQGDALVSLYCDGASVYFLKPKDFINVLSYQLQIDKEGVADSTAGLRLAQILGKKLGMTLLLPGGTYLLTDRIPMKVSLQGGDTGEVIIKAASTFASENVKTFNGTAANPGNNTINIPAHGFNTGDCVPYDNGGGTSIGGLVSGQHYFISDYADSNNVQLALTEEDAYAGIPVSITADGVGASHTLTRKLMMLDFNDGLSPFENEGVFLRNITLDANQRPGVAALSSTSEGGAGGGGHALIEGLKIKNVYYNTYPIEALSTLTENGFLSYATINSLDCASELSLNMGVTQVRPTFNSPYLSHQGPNVGLETDPFMRIVPEGILFNNVTFDRVQNTGYSFNGSYEVFPLIHMTTSGNYGVHFNGISVLSSAGGNKLTCVFAVEQAFNLRITDMKIGIADGINNAARAVVYFKGAGGTRASSLLIAGIVRSQPNPVAFPRLLEADRSALMDDEQNAVVVHASGIDNAAFHDFPFTTLQTQGTPQPENFGINWRGHYQGCDYSVAFNEGNSDPETANFGFYKTLFDAATAVDLTNNEIDIPNHQYMTGDAVYYTSFDNAAIGGLVTRSIYFAIRVGAGAIGLATTQFNAFAGTKIPLTAVGVNDHKLERRYRARSTKYSVAEDLIFVDCFDLDAVTPVSSVSQIVFNNLNEFERYKLVIENYVPDTNNVNLHMLLSDDNGATFYQGATDYSWGNINNKINGPFIQMCFYSLGSFGNEYRYYCEAYIDTTKRPQQAYVNSFASYKNAGNNLVAQGMSGLLNISTIVNAIRLELSAGNHWRGRMVIYGVRDK